MHGIVLARHWNEFTAVLKKHQIPLENIIGLGSDHALSMHRDTPITVSEVINHISKKTRKLDFVL